MNDIILSMQNGEPVVSSRQIAESFEKRHDHVMRDIEDIMRGLPKNGDTPMFYKTEYVHEQNGQSYPMYLMNRDGFTLLASMARLLLSGSSSTLQRLTRWKRSWLNSRSLPAHSSSQPH